MSKKREYPGDCPLDNKTWLFSISSDVERMRESIELNIFHNIFYLLIIYAAYLDVKGAFTYYSVYGPAVVAIFFGFCLTRSIINEITVNKKVHKLIDLSNQITFFDLNNSNEIRNIHEDITTSDKEWEKTVKRWEKEGIETFKKE